MKKLLLLLLCICYVRLNSVIIKPVTGLTDNNLMYSGSLPISSSSTDSLFFLYYGVDGEKNESNLNKYPLLISVGSPGNSAQYMNLASMGPLRLQSNLSLITNENRLSTKANLMFIDLLGSGFSFVQNISHLPDTYKQYSTQLSYAINAFIDSSAMGKSQVIILAGQGTFTRNLDGLSDIDPLDGIIHLSSWPELFALGKYYGVAGLDMQIFGNSQKIAIQTTISSCYRSLQNQKFLQAHQCYDSILDFVELKTQNINLFNTKIGSSLTQNLPLIQYYFSLPDVIQKYGAPSSSFFQSQSSAVWNHTYIDLAQNITGLISQFTQDNYSIKHWFITSEYDYICYRPAILNWLYSELNFFERDEFVKKSFDDIIFDEQKVGRKKSTAQISYSEFYTADHYINTNSTIGFKNEFEQWIATLQRNSNNLIHQQ